MSMRSSLICWMGHRSLCDKHKEDYADYWLRGWSSWLYMQLVMRDCFVHHDPVVGSADGGELKPWPSG
jgi:hypothetical protein